MAAMTTMHETNIKNAERCDELEADLKKIKQRERVLKEKIQLKEREIVSQKSAFADQ